MANPAPFPATTLPTFSCLVNVPRILLPNAKDELPKISDTYSYPLLPGNENEVEYDVKIGHVMPIKDEN